MTICSSGTKQLSDLQLEYLEPDESDMSPEIIPKGWPQFQKPNARYPFNGGLIDYCRLIGPGVMVGLGWKKRKEGMAVGTEFLHFLLIRTYD